MKRPPARSRMKTSAGDVPRMGGRSRASRRPRPPPAPRGGSRRSRGCGGRGSARRARGAGRRRAAPISSKCRALGKLVRSTASASPGLAAAVIGHAVAPGAGEVGRRRLAEGRGVDDAGDEPPVDLHPDRNAPLREPAGEVGGAVDRVDVPDHAPPALPAALLADDGRLRHRRADVGGERDLGGAVMGGDDVVGVALGRHRHRGAEGREQHRRHRARGIFGDRHQAARFGVGRHPSPVVRSETRPLPGVSLRPTATPWLSTRCTPVHRLRVRLPVDEHSPRRRAELTTERPERPRKRLPTLHARARIR